MSGVQDMRLRRLSPRQVPQLRRDPVDGPTLSKAREIVDTVRAEGLSALQDYAQRYGDWSPGDPLWFGPEDMASAFFALPVEKQQVLTRTADRIKAFAEAQHAGLKAIEAPIPGGVAGVRFDPVERAGCYAPGGRFPLPSSVLMTAIPARVAGVDTVWVASPRPAPETLAAAHAAGADALLAVGGAQAIAALAFGAGPVPACDAVVGPGNIWVTAAKQIAAGRVAIDMLAGPSELVVLADAGADPDRVAADLLAQAEHDPDALPVLIALDPMLLSQVDRALSQQLADLSTADIARQALDKGFAVAVGDLAEGVALCDRMAPEHLALHLDEPVLTEAANTLSHYGALFVGGDAAEALGDYGIGPNHVLPTGGTARSYGGLSVMTFLRARTWMRVDDVSAAQGAVSDAVALARMEGLEAHARSAALRLKG
ncbi:MAG: histidinol dehydrogenase [Bradymonadia bacterium]